MDVCISIKIEVLFKLLILKSNRFDYFIFPISVVVVGLHNPLNSSVVKLRTTPRKQTVENSIPDLIDFDLVCLNTFPISSSLGTTLKCSYYYLLNLNYSFSLPEILQVHAIIDFKIQRNRFFHDSKVFYLFPSLSLIFLKSNVLVYVPEQTYEKVVLVWFKFPIKCFQKITSILGEITSRLKMYITI